jgi:hypothetical protein
MRPPADLEGIMDVKFRIDPLIESKRSPEDDLSEEDQERRRMELEKIMIAKKKWEEAGRPEIRGDA